MEEKTKIMKKKKPYCKPEMHLEKFTPSEYIATCWTVKCEGATADQWEKDHYNYHDGSVNHTGDCTKKDHQFLYDSNGDGIIDGMYEMSSYQGRLNATLYTDSKYNAVKAFSSVKLGDYIYWTTNNSSYTWHHQGTVSSNGSSNHS